LEGEKNTEIFLSTMAGVSNLREKKGKRKEGTNVAYVAF